MPQFLDTGQAHQAFVGDYVIFELAEQVAATSNEVGLALPSGEQTDDLVQAGRLNKRKRSHRTPFPCSCIACSTRCGVNGTSRNHTPVALATALATAASTGTTGGSPRALAPYGPTGSGPEGKSTSIGGKSTILVHLCSRKLAFNVTPRCLSKYSSSRKAMPRNCNTPPETWFSARRGCTMRPE